MRGSALSGRWSVRANKVSWTADTAGRKANDIERLVWRVIGGLNDLSVVAQLGGTFSSPQLSIASNLDQAIAQRLKAVVGEEVARAERMVRAKVDSLVAEKVQPVKRQVAEVQTKAIQRIAGERQRLDQVEAELNAQLKRLTGGLAPGLELPKIKL
jgi:multidrug efflux pump subunit AcrB